MKEKDGRAVRWSLDANLWSAPIRAGPQDSWDPARVDAVDERMRFGIWTGLAAHRPLGNINRTRDAPYRHSAEFRERFNGCPIREPAGR